MMIMLFAAEKNFRRQSPLSCVSSNYTHQLVTDTRIYYAYAPIRECKWTIFMAVCFVAYDADKFAIESTEENGDFAMIPFRLPVRKKHTVVACFSPLFFNERWQLLLAGLEIRRTFGVSMQKYAEIGLASIQEWSRIDIGNLKATYDPNLELDWRNQAAAHTDCLINYKDSAAFIIIADIDDILFPQIAPTYFEEFQILRQRTKAAAFIYERFITDIYTGSKPVNFSLASLLLNGIVRNKWEHGKWVADPKYIASAWIHWPGVMKSDHRLYHVPYEMNFMPHFRNWHFDVNADSEFSIPLRSLISSENVDRIQSNFVAMASENLTSILPSLRRRPLYYPLIEDCYNAIFYNVRTTVSECPGPIRCEIPRMRGIRCMNARINHGHSRLEPLLFIHYPIRATFEESFDGCYI
ncbi:UPF0392 protein F59C6.8 [Toxocara canis]|uniref:Glycosyltransferase family 92 protein n=1 Tax=Toxocara canis TaxID=6265 RepID=A0A0B2VAD1_TOXCA|nr:UPF0392 protein F59C6.8 [Toxocara canis]